MPKVNLPKDWATAAARATRRTVAQPEHMTDFSEVEGLEGVICQLSLQMDVYCNTMVFILFYFKDAKKGAQ